MKREVLVSILCGLLALSFLFVACAKPAPAPASPTAVAPKPTPTATAAPSPSPSAKPTPSPTVVAKKTVTIGYIGDFSGPLAEATKRSYQATLDLAKWATETGYIPGLNIEIATEDDRYDQAQVITAYKKVKEKNPLLLTSYPAQDAEVTKALCIQDKIPFVNYQGSNPVIDPPGWTFISSPVWDAMFVGFLNWIDQTWDKTKMGRAARVGTLAWDNTMGTAYIEPGRKYAQKLGIDYVAAEVTPPRTMEFAGNVLKFKQTNADYIWLPLVWGPASAFVKEAVAAGIPTSKIVFTETSGTAWTVVLRLLPDDNLREGTLMTTAYEFRLNEKGLDQAFNVWQRYNKGDRAQFGSDWRNGYAIGYNVSLIIVEAFHLAASQVGPAKVDGTALYEALQKVKLDPGTMLHTEFGPTRRMGIDTMQMLQWTKGEFQRVGNTVSALQK